MPKYGQTWWGGEWMKALSHIDYSNRLPRGRNYANKGAVREIWHLYISTCFLLSVTKQIRREQLLYQLTVLLKVQIK